MRLFQKQDVSLLTIAFNTFALYFGFTVWRVIFNNFAKEVLDITPAQIGIIQSVREVPGLLGFTIGALALYLAEVKIATLSIVLAGVGLIMVGHADSVFMLGVGTLIMSVGFHSFLSSNDALLLHFIKTKESGKAQGKIKSTESLAGVTATLCVLVTTFFFGYRETLTAFGVLVILVGFYFTFILKPNRAKEEERKVTLKKKYSLYYLLSFLRGCRRHIFTTFAIFLLVANHQISISTAAILFFISNVLTVYTNRLMGNLVEKWGERAVLAGSSFLLVFIFSGYAYIPWLPLLAVFYVADNMLFGSSIALHSYVRKISDKADLTSCISFSVTINHISAVILPVLGGLIWEVLGFKATFLFGAAIVLIDMLFSLRVKTGREVRTGTSPVPAT
ncbi:MAG: MFS transporter [candidate division Zixibacteria bacterium]|nr:MFS transporter [candidate division Zixibacteria bacterium]